MNTPLLRSLSSIVCLLALAGCARLGSTEETSDIPGYQITKVEHGEASWYSVRTNRGTHTASGQRLENHSATAAHRKLPFGTKVRVTNELNGLSEIVTINNRGPFIRGRIIDVTIGTAAKLGFQGRGVAPVKVEVLERVADASS